MLDKDQFEQIGSVGRTHGIHGEVSMRLDIELAALIEAEERAFLMLEEDGLLIPYAIESHRSKAGDVDLVRFAGITTKEQAERLVGMPVWLDRDYIGEDEPSLDPTDWQRYIGYQLYDASTQELVGEVVDMDDSTLNVLLVVERPDGEELLLPIADELLASVHDDELSLWLHIPLGLLDDSAQYDIHD